MYRLLTILKGPLVVTSVLCMGQAGDATVTHSCFSLHLDIKACNNLGHVPKFSSAAPSVDMAKRHCA